jgi:DNA-binding NarL/FixJ family response regulator
MRKTTAQKKSGVRGNREVSEQRRRRVKPYLFLIQWDKASALQRARELRLGGWQVEVETEDGALAYKRIREDPPQVVVIDLSRLPSHGRETARATRELKAMHKIPIVFVDGTPENIEKARQSVEEATFASSAGLRKALTKYQRGRGAAK